MRPSGRLDWIPPCAVSIHALLAECDCAEYLMIVSYNSFQSTHSLRSATDCLRILNYQPVVSIHALLAECDRAGRPGHDSNVGFNPRTPCGVRPNGNNPDNGTLIVSIHALLAECDDSAGIGGNWMPSFNPRTPCGVRLYATGRVASYCRFQSTHSLRSATRR